MDIRGLSYARLKQLIDADLVHDAADLYAVQPEQLVALDRFAERSAQALVAAIAESRQRPLSKLLFALGIRHVGATAAELLGAGVPVARRADAGRRGADRRGARDR